MRWSDQEVWDVAEDPTRFKLWHVPVHSTAVEHQIGLGTQLASNYPVGDGDEGERFEQEMANMKFSHQRVSEFKSKQDYRPHLLPPSMPPPRQPRPRQAASPPPPRPRRATAPLNLGAFEDDEEEC